MQLGNGKWESTVSNSRLQPTQIALGTVQGGTDKLNLVFDYGTTTNNGNVLSQTITVPTVGTNQGWTATQAYTYDSLNRIKQATETIPNQTGWQQTYEYDRYGNRTFDEANTTTLPKNCQSGGTNIVCAADVPKVNPAASAANNRLTGYTFDEAGNTTVDAQGRTFTYDAENKQSEVKDASNNRIGTYYYDGDGKRVKKITYDQYNQPQETTIFVYDASGKLVAEYSTAPPADDSNARVSYLTSDHLGSRRINTDKNGAVLARHDYMPFGEEIDSTVTPIRNINYNYGDDAIRKKFTQYERDYEYFLKYMQAFLSVIL